MSQVGLFSFGCVIFFIVITGALLYGMSVVRDAAERSDYIRTPQPDAGDEPTSDSR